MNEPMTNGPTSSSHVELFVRAGQDGKCYGASPFCQQVFMILLLKADDDSLSFRVTTVNPAKSPPEFKKLSNRLPTLVHGNEVRKNSDEIIEYIDETFPKPSLAYDDRNAESVCLEVFSKFAYYLKEVSRSPTQLITELGKINEFLDAVGTRFLCGDHLTHLDCLMLPKLHHIRVTVKAYKDFEIPAEFRALWRYLKNAYETDTFQKSCPSDQEIVYYWSEKPETPQLPTEAAVKYAPTGDPFYSWDTPL
ncbi:chloride intracellular channel protein 2-like [Tubulanus polymorphus]|uniref:chloride intracellular channel protein 2-like n=1 Tax=Tubulanus polymorphus TaxID=672921 RepID=UPI003DA6CAB5